MNPLLGWALAAAALAAGWYSYGWAGVVLAVSVIVFWLLLQFSRVMRVMQRAGARPVGHVDSAVMLHARMARGLRLIDILPMAGSLGRKVGDDPEAFEWADASGAVLRIELAGGRCTGWALRRPDEPAPAGVCTSRFRADDAQPGGDAGGDVEQVANLGPPRTPS